MGGALDAGAEVELSLLLGALAPEPVLDSLAGAPAASRMHFSFSAPVIDSQLAVLVGVEALLPLSPVAL